MKRSSHFILIFSFKRNLGEKSFKGEEILEKMPDSPQKNLIILLFAAQNEEKAFYLEWLCPHYPTCIEKLIQEGVLN